MLLPFNDLIIKLVETNNYYTLESWRDYIRENMYKYPLVQLNYASEIYQCKCKNIDFTFSDLERV